MFCVSCPVWSDHCFTFLCTLTTAFLPCVFDMLLYRDWSISNFIKKNLEYLGISFLSSFFVFISIKKLSFPEAVAVQHFIHWQGWTNVFATNSQNLPCHLPLVNKLPVKLFRILIFVTYRQPCFITWSANIQLSRSLMELLMTIVTTCTKRCNSLALLTVVLSRI